jgi:hypothetical protein
LNTEKTSVVAPPISTPIRLMHSPFGDGLHDDADRRRGRHDGRAGHLDQFLIAGSLLHDMFEEQVVDFVAGRRKVFAFEHRPDIVGKIQGGLLA